MSSISGQGANLLSSFQTATQISASSKEAVTVSVPANRAEGGAGVVSIFRTTKK